MTNRKSDHDVDPNTKFEAKSNASRLGALRDSARARVAEYGTSTSTSTSKRKKFYREHWQRRVDAKFPRTKPCTVIDVFGGSGTTAAAALELGREAISIDASADYTELSKKRTGGVTPSLALW